MRHIDLFSGILGFSECARRVWGEEYELVAICEIDKNCHLVERRHRPGVQIITNVEEFDGREQGATHILSFGWPCQDLSVAGKREGLAGSRSGLLYEAVRILAETKARWFVAENVPGLLSSFERRDMGTAIRLMEELGYCVSWTVLDAQFTGVAQRRERVFFVGSLGNTGSIQVLFEPESVCWNPAPSREKGKGASADVAPSIGASGRGFSRAGESRRQDPVVAVTQCVEDVIGVSSSGNGYWREGIGALRARGQDSHENLIIPLQEMVGFMWQSGQGGLSCVENGMGTIIKNQTPAVCFTERTRADGRNLECSEIAYCVTNPGSGGRTHSRQVMNGMQVRRLTPVECARLQGYPDDWCAWGIDENGKRVEISDTQQYRMLGNAIALPPVEWIMKRIKSVDEARKSS